MAINGADDNGIQFNVGLDEGNFYNSLKNKKITELEDIPIYNPNLSTLADNINYIKSKIEFSNIDSDLKLCPVLLEGPIDNSKKWTENDFNYFVANEYFTPNEANNFSGSSLIYKERIIRENIGGELVDVKVPLGYGIAPYPKIWKVLEIIFDNLGYKIIGDNPFKTHEQLKLLIVLHNVVDAICSGKIIYRQLLPDVNIQPFLDSLFYKFGALFIINFNEKTVRIKLLKDIISDINYEDITALKSSNLSWTKIQPKQLRLRMKTSLKYASREVLTIDELIKFYGNSISKIIWVHPWNALTYTPYDTSNPLNINNIIYDRQSGNYYKRYERWGGEVYRVTDPMCSGFFDWDKKTERVEYEDYDSIDESVPMVIHPVCLSHLINQPREETFLPKYPPITIPAFITGKRHINTCFQTQQNDISTPEEEKESVFGFVFHYGTTLVSFPPKVPIQAGSLILTQSKFDFASPFLPPNMDSSEKEKYKIELTGPSLYEHFFKEWDKILRYSNQEYTGKFAFSKFDCLKFDISKKIMIDNQVYLPLEFSYALKSLNEKKEAELKLRTTKLLSEPINLGININYNEPVTYTIV
jgi:hypothetical protein